MIEDNKLVVLMTCHKVCGWLRAYEPMTDFGKLLDEEVKKLDLPTEMLVELNTNIGKIIRDVMEGYND